MVQHRAGSRRCVHEARARKSLMAALLMVVRDVFRDRELKVPLARRPDSAETVRLDRENRAVGGT